MAIRVPPGRAGRLWLLRRLEVAAGGREVLDQKRQTLLREQQRLSILLREAAAEWERLAGEAARWNDRASAIAGARRLRLAGRRLDRAEVTVEWRNVLGATLPGRAAIRLGDPPDLVALGGGSSIALAAEAHARALTAAATYAAARTAHEALRAELTATNRRLRAIERRWIPSYQALLATLEQALDESDLEDITRVRWALERR